MYFFVIGILVSLVLPIVIKSMRGKYVENVYYISNIVSAFFVMGGVAIALREYYLHNKSEIANHNREGIRRAVELSEYYKDNILSKLAIIEYVYEQAGIKKILDKIDSSKMKNFDYIELHQVLSEEDIQKLKDILLTPDFVKAVVEINDAYNLKLFEYQKEEFFDEKNQKEVKVYIDPRNVVNAFMRKIVNGTLNNMEYFAMNFTHNLADKSTVYQALHQTYIRTVRTLYYTIAKQNVIGKSPLYQNTVKLYLDWSKEHNEKEECKENENRTISDLGSTVENLD